MPDRVYGTLYSVLCTLLVLLPGAARGEGETEYRVEMLVFSTPGGASAEVWEATPTLAYPGRTRTLLDADDPAAAALQGEPDAGPLTAGTAAPDLGSPPPFITLPTSALEFRAAATRMEHDGRYRKLFHKAWIQPIPSRGAAIPIVLDRSGDGGPWPALQGTVTLYISRYIYVETNLWLNTNGEYLHSAWRMPPPPLGPPTTAPAYEDALTDAVPPAAQPVAAQPVSVPPEPAPTATGPTYPYAHAVLLHQTRRMRSGEVNYIDHPLLGVIIKVTPVKRESDADPA